MKEVTHGYGIELFWKDNPAGQLDGYIDGSYIRVPEEIHPDGALLAHKINIDLRSALIAMNKP